MCGIAGSVFAQFDHAVADAALRHRGPDAGGMYSDEDVQLHHRRLSILDLEGGTQPMHYLDRYVVVFNGEIYNHLDVRRELDLAGQTHSDTETILMAWHREGAAMLQRCDGMFAFALYDRMARKLWLVRDRAGKKPLYYYFSNGSIVFASELNTLRALLPLEPDYDAMINYLRLGSGFGSQTCYKGVRELLPAHWLCFDLETRTVETRRWWSLPLPVQHEGDAGDYRDQLEQLLHLSVKRRLLSSDVEVGCFLSGGIDSGLVTAMAAGISHRLRTFTISFDGSYDEAPLARRVAEKYGTDHQEIRLSLSGLRNDITGILSQYGEPFYDSSAVPSWYVSRAARQYLTVVLNGDGADELFGGYRRYVPFARYNFFNMTAAARSLCSGLSRLLPPAHDKRSAFNYLSRLLFLASRSGWDAYLAATSDIFEGYEHWLKPHEPFRASMEASHEAERLLAMPGSGLQQLMLLDFHITLPCDFLVKMDIATMAHSLEGRSPFLSREIMEWSVGLPDNCKVRGSETKWLLRRLAEKYLPPELPKQPKRGFEVPLLQWVDGDLRDVMGDYLHSAGNLHSQLMDQQYFQQLWENRVSISREKRAKQLWTLFAIEVWYRHCCIRNASETQS